jgi:quinolinate synthase
MNALQGVLACLDSGSGEIQVPEPVRSRAAGCIERMLDFVKVHPQSLTQPARGAPAGLVPNLGAS